MYKPRPTKGGRRYRRRRNHHQPATQADQQATEVESNVEITCSCCGSSGTLVLKLYPSDSMNEPDPNCIHGVDNCI